MPVKIARSAPRPSFGLPVAAGSHPRLASVLQQGWESANIRLSLGVIRGIPVRSLDHLRTRWRRLMCDAWLRRFTVLLAFAGVLFLCSPGHSDIEGESIDGSGVFRDTSGVSSTGQFTNAYQFNL